MKIQNRIICLTPVYNDWESFSFLIKEIREQADINSDFKFSIVAINDGSTEENNYHLSDEKIDIKIVDLKTNVGHQRAIAIGIQFIADQIKNSNIKDGHVVVLDSDGEDKPSDIIEMVKKAKARVIFAQRVKRSESMGFKVGYFFYKLIFELLTGEKINFGNFSAIPFSLINQIAILPNMWNHYASSIAESRLPIGVYPTNRGIRYAGKSKMNTMSLIIHGFSSISIYFDKLCFRVLKFSFFLILFFLLIIGFVLYNKLFTDNAIPGWASSLILIVLSIVVQLFSVTFIILLFQLSFRKSISPPNTELYKSFIHE